MIIAQRNEWPCIIDFEASGLGPSSYPIEVAWSLSDGSIKEHLINPDTAPTAEDWTGWDWNSQAVHGLAREYLLAHGENALAVASRMNESLRGTKVYSDNVAMDGFWCERLFCCVDFEMEFEILDYYELLRSFGLNSDPKIQQLRGTAARRVGGQMHRAGTDVRILFEMLILAETGSF